MKSKLLPLLCATLLGGLVVSSHAALVHESDFDQITGTNPVTAGDVTEIFATGGSIFGHGNGFYHYPGDGTLLFRHPAHEWDDSMFALDTTGLVGPTDPVEFEFDFDTNNITTVGQNATVEILLTNPGQNFADSRANADVVFWFQSDAGSASFVGFGVGGSDPAIFGITTTADNIDDVKVVINHDGTVWRAYYSINGGSLFEAPGSPITAARTTTAFRVECDNTPWAPTMDSWELIAKNLRVYDSIETTGPVLVPGEVLRVSNFNSPAGSVGLNGHFFPIAAGDVNSLFINTADGGAHEYDGTAWNVSHDGDQADGWNASILTVEDGTQDAEWVLDVKPQFPIDGERQMFNFKVDGAGGSFYLANDTGNSGTIRLIFGEETNIFAPDPGNVATLVNDAATLTDLKLIINYNATLQEYNGFYAENGGTIIPHPGNPLAKARTDASVEFQWQCWNTGGSTPFTVGLDHYEEQYGISTIDTSSVVDFMLLD